MSDIIYLNRIITIYHSSMYIYFFFNYVPNVRNCYLLKKITHENSSKLRVISCSLLCILSYIIICNTISIVNWFGQIDLLNNIQTCRL